MPTICCLFIPLTSSRIIEFYTVSVAVGDGQAKYGIRIMKKCRLAVKIASLMMIRLTGRCTFSVSNPHVVQDNAVALKDKVKFAVGIDSRIIHNILSFTFLGTEEYSVPRM